ncbi:hypothetical protein J4210_06650 [Candidatus Woesearchaeota archaeon]|nr:hypothetical protein [Candidatus Woesearchaeota archaeon]
MLFLTAGLLFVVKSVTTEKAETEREVIVESSEFNSINLFINHCLEKTSNEGLQFVSFRGGYYHVPEPAEDQIFVKIPYYFDLGQKHFPTKEDIADQIGLYIEDNMKTCLNDFVVFKDQGFHFVEEEMNADVQLGKTVRVELDYPLQTQKAESIKEFREFSYLLPVNFEHIYSIIDQTVFEQEKNVNFVPLGHLSAASQENDFTFEVSYLDDDVVVYSYLFEQYRIDRKEYVFVFANRYDWPELAATEELDYAQEVHDQRCLVGDICSYNLNIYQDPFRFEDYTVIFNISAQGKIEFTPQQKDVGTHNILVRVSDSPGKEKFLSFALNIESLAEKPELKIIPSQEAAVNQEFTYQVQLEKVMGGVVFSDDTDLFDIDETGLITFTPTAEAVGFHIVEITVQKGELTDTKWMYLTVLNTVQNEE